MDYDLNPIQVLTPYSYEQMKAFQRFHLRKARVGSIIILCWFSFVMIINVFMFDFSSPVIPPTYLITMFLVFACIGLLPFLVLSGAFYTRKAHFKATKLMQNGQSYSFCNNDYTYASEQGDNVMQGRTAYSAILHVWETKDIFYLYTAKNQAILVDKAGFRTGSPDELRAILQAHIPGNKYKRYKV